MSLTNIVYTPVDTGTAKISPKRENANLRDFYLLTGKINSDLTAVATLRLATTILIIGPLPPSPSPPEAERSGTADLL